MNRRSFLARALAFGVAFVQGWWSRPARAETDYFTGTDFVGKNRAGKFKQFYINYWKPFRRIKAEDWSLAVEGLCERPRSFSLKELGNLPKVTQTSRLKCVECWSAKAEWRGFHFSELMKLCPPQPQATGAVFHCGDNYNEHLSLADLNHPRTLLVTEMNGAPLSDEHGFPLRIIIPSKYGYKNPKAILKIEYVSQLRYGTWSKIGPYSPDGTILPGTDHPLDLGKIPRRIPGGEITAY
ncbi:MAG: molybdopterin-dependent oxidoreductase [Nitrospinaceae bacterium]|nr:molybdopterin-dependent oxidoreductase [Nitrospinaceae bacterium]NIR55106.1 molybdopterin-dependent oxidoreductase [Nitrospinaceae bacterium]NIS85521.1 molybdopterin-dependent oxidoreductase [Nitrospinaceae bacterium]NIT82355.1 molybdopterin-dependent oxidoreductase [Nitrospinaceae bacterium]NIU44571.1 molybdopterin-dependent oxidoreductase [Nitrospinaceae bacterium]